MNGNNPAAAGRTPWFLRPSFIRVSPFALFMGFVAVQEGLRCTAAIVPAESETLMPLLFTGRGMAAGFLLFLFRGEYTEINWREVGETGKGCASVLTGILVFVLWIALDGGWGTYGVVRGFDPGIFPDVAGRWSMIFFRTAGMGLVVPVMEELFWRSFLARWLLDSDFQRVPVGRFTKSSFIFSAVLFGLEHNMVAAGIVAGILYNLLLRLTGSISCCIAAHALTNSMLCVYILINGTYHLW
ncbi:MAG TPA: CAAX prenyl protease-related protein [Verrucomicrobiae bacterium]|nr:CAAX prenyl protease-related protein [Verrucomicrobiae bacterium]